MIKLLILIALAVSFATNADAERRWFVDAAGVIVAMTRS